MSSKLNKLNQQQILSQVYLLLERLTTLKFNFVLKHHSSSQSMTIISVTDADNIKKFCPEFEIKRDERQQRYAELVINYE